MTPKIPRDSHVNVYADYASFRCAKLMGLGMPFSATLNVVQIPPVSGCWHIMILCIIYSILGIQSPSGNATVMESKYYMRFGGDCTPQSFSDKAALFNSRSQPGSYDSTDGTATDSPSSN